MPIKRDPFANQRSQIMEYYKNLTSYYWYTYNKKYNIFLFKN